MGKLSPISKAKQEALVRSTKRKEDLAALNDHIGFWVNKIAGFTALGIGVTELVNPDFHPVTATTPEAVAAIGVALLSGPKIISMLAKVLNAIK